jgi:putative nucleotidyltransferase with HDIG domain
MIRNEALDLVTQYVKSISLINHMLAVEAAMAYYANALDQNEETWRITGLLHDFDWEIHPTEESHPSEGEPILRKNLVSEEIIHAILSHSNHLGISRVTLLDKGLYACDEVTGLITAVALIRPSKSLYDLTVNSIKKKWKVQSFAEGVDRKEIEHAVDDFGVDLWEHVNNVINAMQKIAPLLNLAGNLTAPLSGN